ncbi:MAG: hypothetical protein EHM35_02800 [Planctomycetaceae bacterium]|nr:MAG: hypothetical protein EHM35_02800 [Planctomycetaceae bacterium]
MMNSCPVPLEEVREPRTRMSTGSAKGLPALWSQMDPGSRQPLAQQIAELIQRIQLPYAEMEGKFDEPS